MKEANTIEQKSLTNVSHELRTRLSVIFACCYMLHETLWKTISKDQLRQLHKIERNAQEIHNLTKDLIDLTDINERKEVVTKKTVNLNNRASLIGK